MYILCTVQGILINLPQFIWKDLGGLMSLADYPNQCAAFSIDLCTKGFG
jgi:hypothetical protein